MRTIKNVLFQRLVAQADEAEAQGLTKVAAILTEKIADSEVRPDDAFYLYASSDFEHTVESKFWDIVIRASDFYNADFDAVEVGALITTAKEEFLQDLRSKFGIKHDIGAHEPTVPGEISQQITLEISEE